jgi:hypothetical protein
VASVLPGDHWLGPDDCCGPLVPGSRRR